MSQNADTRSSTLPKEMSKEDRALLERWGVRFGKDQDALYVNVTLPGWNQQSTGYKNGMYLLDEQGRIRAVVNFKSILHDSFATLQVLRRYSVSMDEHCDAQGNPVEHLDDATHLKTVAKDGRTELKVFGILPRSEHPEKRFETADAAEDWLTQHFPQWRDKAAYWD